MIPYIPQSIQKMCWDFYTGKWAIHSLFSIQGDFLAVNGMTTKFTKESIDTAHRGLKCIVGNAKATKMVARAIQSQLEKIF